MNFELLLSFVLLVAMILGTICYLTWVLNVVIAKMIPVVLYDRLHSFNQ